MTKKSETKGTSAMVHMVFVLLWLVTVSCNATKLGNSQPSGGSSNVKVASDNSVKSPIREIDFGNVRYTNFPNYGTGPNRITLEPGKAKPAFVDYGDVTGDGKEEAFVVFPTPTHGTAIPYHVYIFALENDKLKTLWDFEAGDRGDGGVRRVYSEDARLIIELYGKNKLVGRLYEKEESVCCPTDFTRVRYQFSGNSFHPIDKPEVLHNPSEDDTVLMPEYKPHN